MLVKENSVTKIIEDKMGFKFKDLILIGKIEDSYMNRIFYKDNNNTFIFFIRYSREICVIRKITNMQEEYDKSMMSLKINGKNYYYYNTKEVLLIDDNFEDELQYYYTFLCYGDEDKKEVFSLPESIELEDEENVIIELLNSFFDENFLDKKKVNHANL